MASKARIPELEKQVEDLTIERDQARIELAEIKVAMKMALIALKQADPDTP